MNILFIFLFIIWVKVGLAAFEDNFITARTSALTEGYNSILPDSSYEAAYFNPTALAYEEELTPGGLKCAFSYSIPLSNITLNKLKSYYLVGIKRISPEIIGALFFKSFGVNSLYRESIIGISGGSKIGENFAVGFLVARYNYGYVLDEYARTDPVFKEGSEKSALSFTIGSSFLQKNIFFDIVVKNLNSPQIGLKEEERLPICLNLSVGYKPQYYPLVIIGGIKLKDIAKTTKHYFFLAAEYNLEKMPILIRGGVSSTLIGVGASLNLGETELSYSLQTPYLVPKRLLSSSLTLKFRI